LGQQGIYKNERSHQHILEQGHLEQGHFQQEIWDQQLFSTSATLKLTAAQINGLKLANMHCKLYTIRNK
jgi:hypothetical protein